MKGEGGKWGGGPVRKESPRGSEDEQPFCGCCIPRCCFCSTSIIKISCTAVVSLAALPPPSPLYFCSVRGRAHAMTFSLLQIPPRPSCLSLLSSWLYSAHFARHLLTSQKRAQCAPSTRHSDAPFAHAGGPRGHARPLPHASCWLIRHCSKAPILQLHPT